MEQRTVAAAGLAIGSFLGASAPQVAQADWCDSQLLACLDSGVAFETCCFEFCRCQGNNWVYCYLFSGCDS